MKMIKALLLVFLSIFITLQVKSQQLDTACSNIMGEVFVDGCTTMQLIPFIRSGETVERCFTFKPLSNSINLGYILLNNTCGPIPPYTWLNFTLYNSTCDSLIQLGEIVPTPSNTFIQGLDTTQYYILCVTWKAGCDQFTICPLIHSSFLPITLIYFDFKYNKINGSININWSTGSEINNDYFQIEKSKNGLDFNPIGIIRGSGNSTITINYSYTDDDPILPITYYRLKQVDYDGNFTYSKIIYCNPLNGENLLIKPNPTKQIIELISESKYDKFVSIDIININGKILETRIVEFIKGYNHIKFDLIDYPLGSYYLRYSDQFIIKNFLFIKVD